MFLRAAAGDAVRVMRALIVDDQASIRSVISKVLSRAGATCEMAGSGEEALERLARAPYDMVFIDLALPGMDGLGLARLIAHRSAASESPTTPCRCRRVRRRTRRGADRAPRGGRAV